ncbi:MAG: LolA family protein [Rickettsiales bacterium]
MNMPDIHRIIRGVLLSASLPIIIGAAPVPSAPEAVPVTNIVQPQTVDNTANIARVEAYLSGLTTISADFSQISADGSLASGKFYLRRPGKMRWQYATPSNVLLVSDGSTVVYYDPAVEQVSYVPVDDTMASFLTRRDVRLESPSIRLTKFESSAGVIRATLVQKRKPKEGGITLEFSDNPLTLQQLVVTDANGQNTSVRLQNPQFGVKLDEALFVFIDPRGVLPKRGVKR